MTRHVLSGTGAALLFLAGRLASVAASTTAPATTAPAAVAPAAAIAAPASTQPVATDPDARLRADMIALLAGGKQADAERLVFQAVPAHPTPSNAYLWAVLYRSRFYRERADAVFAQIAKATPATLDGQVARRIADIDAGQDTDANFTALDKLSSDHPDDPLILWMVCVECRQLNKNKVGIERYTRLLQQWSPGPALVHQTLGNLLMADHHPAKALKQYDAAIAMEPAAWGYNCRGNALWALGKIPEATAAYTRATELDPDYELTYSNWALMLDDRGDAKGAAEKRAKLAEIQTRKQKAAGSQD